MSKSSVVGRPAEEKPAALRQEIVESQKSQADFLKWKLIAVATVASISLGLPAPGAAAVSGAKLLLCLIPLVCAYVDLISLHLMIRMIVIGTYLRKKGDEYEVYVYELRRDNINPFTFEVIALHGSSFVFGGLLVALGFLLPTTGADAWPQHCLTAYIVAGFAGSAFTIFSWLFYSFRAREVLR